jgi:predicted esterase
MGNPHSSAGRLLHGAELADATLVVVAVHGRGHSPQYLVDNLIKPLEDGDDAREIASRGIATSGIAWLLPAAHDNRWYPEGFMSPIADNEPWLGYSLELMADIERELTRPIVWAGFSQGASLVTEFVARHRNEVPAGLICLTGSVIGPPEAASPVVGSLDGMPAYFSNSESDEWVPLSRTEATAAAFQDAGADTELEIIRGREHVISAAEIESIARFLRHIAG